MLSDPIADMLTRIRNGYLASKKEVEIPYAKIKGIIAKILLERGYLTKIKEEIRQSAKKSKKRSQIKVLVCQLKYTNNRPAITRIVRISKPSLRTYSSSQKIPRIFGGRKRGIVIVSTPKGIMVAKEAKEKNVGGEIICQVW